MDTTMLTDEIIRNIVQISIPIIASLAVRVLAKSFNGLIDYKRAKLELDRSKKQQTDALIKKRLDEQDIERFNKIAVEGITFAYELAWKSFLDPKVKEKTFDEKFNDAKGYILDNISSQIKNPENVKAFQEVVDKKIEAILPTVRSDLDKQYKNMKVEYIKKNGSIPENSINPITSKNKKVR